MAAEDDNQGAERLGPESLIAASTATSDAGTDIDPAPRESVELSDNSEGAPQAESTSRPHPASDTRPGRIVLILLAVIVLAGFGLRVWGIGWSLPDERHPLATYHPDERVNLNAALQADVVHGKFDIQFYNYGTLYFYLADIAQSVGRGYRLIPKTPASADDLPPLDRMRAQALEFSGLFLAGRIVSVLLGAATIPVLFALGSRLYGPKVGLVASAFYAFAPLAALHAHFFTVDAGATFFVTLCLMQSARLMEIPRAREYLLAGLWAGLAAATRYNAGIVVLAPIAAHLSGARLTPSGARRPAFICLPISAALVTFLIACPGPWLNFDAFWNGIPGYDGSGLRYELFVHSRIGHGYVFTDTGPGWWYNLVVNLPAALGWALLLAGLAGVVQAGVARTSGDRSLLAFLLIYYLMTSLSAVRFARYMLPIVPVFCLLAARTLISMRRLGFPRGCRAIVTGVVLLATALQGYWSVRPLARPDPRDMAADYLEHNAKPGASIAFATTPWFYSPPLSPLFGEPGATARAHAAQHTDRFRLLINPSQEWDAALIDSHPDYVVLSNLETADQLTRLHLPAPAAFNDALHSGGYRDHAFLPDASPFYLRNDGAGAPQDMMYAQPIIHLFVRQ